MVLWICQFLFGIAALIAASRAAWAVAFNERKGSHFLILAGAFSFVFFLSFPDVMPEMLALSVLAVITGCLLMPAELQRSARDLMEDDMDIGGSTAARRLKR